MRTAPLVAILIAAPLGADVRLPAVIGEHMVLQRDSTVTLWGWADPGEEVTVGADFLEEARVVTADAAGTWSVQVPTPPAGGPHSLTFTAANEIALTDVMSGEVWACSGQSNMQWSVAQSANAQEEIAAATWPRMRIFNVTRKAAMAPVDDCQGEWRAVSPDTISGFSAVGFFFGRELHSALDVPVGLIGTNWGGTLCEAWTSETSLRAHGGFDGALDGLEKRRSGQEGTPSTLEGRLKTWWEGFAQKEPGMSAGWMEAGFDDSGWDTSAQPALWRDFGHGGHDGALWLRREVELPARLAGADLVLELGPVDDNDVTFFNGVEIGAARVNGRWNVPRRYAVPGSLVREGRNVIALCAVDTSGAGGLAGEPEALRLVREVSEDTRTTIPLAGQWRHARGATLGDLGAWPRDANRGFNQNTPTALFNGMIAPLVPYGIRGAIWYQGESNRGRAHQYRTLFQEMIRDWRKVWGRGEFPFYFVQIAPYRYGGDSGQAAELREAQAMALALPNTGMAVTMDVGNPADIHPVDKQTVGHRLALWALAKTYHQDVVAFSGPLYRDLRVEGGKARLRFDHADQLKTRDGAAPSHLQISGEDRVFHPAEAAIEGRELVVWSPDVPEPVAVRYAWGAADEPNLCNGGGLPSPSFRTDDWPSLTGP